MARKLKVYGWGDDPAGQRRIVAATSQKAAAEAAGERQSRMWNLTETGNDLEIVVAMAEPGVVFVAHGQGRRRSYTRLLGS